MSTARVVPCEEVSESKRPECRESTDSSTHWESSRGSCVCSIRPLVQYFGIISKQRSINLYCLVGAGCSQFSVIGRRRRYKTARHLSKQHVIIVGLCQRDSSLSLSIDLCRPSFQFCTVTWIRASFSCCFYTSALPWEKAHAAVHPLFDFYTTVPHPKNRLYTFSFPWIAALTVS